MDQPAKGVERHTVIVQDGPVSFLLAYGFLFQLILFLALVFVYVIQSLQVYNS